VSSGAWTLLVGGGFGLAAAWLPQWLAARAEHRRRRTALVATFLTQCERLARWTVTQRVFNQHRPKLAPELFTFDAILPVLNQAAYELCLVSNGAVVDAIHEMQLLNDNLVEGSLPGVAESEHTRVVKAQRAHTDHLLKLLS
jgi:hypothetical protein